MPRVKQKAKSSFGVFEAPSKLCLWLEYGVKNLVITFSDKLSEAICKLKGYSWSVESVDSSHAQAYRIVVDVEDGFFANEDVYNEICDTITSFLDENAMYDQGEAFLKSEVHFIGMGGTRGCLPDTCEAFPTLKQAADYLGEHYHLGSDRRRRLRTERFVNLSQMDVPEPLVNEDLEGVDYAEIQECHCDNPDVHCDSGEYDAS